MILEEKLRACLGTDTGTAQMTKGQKVCAIIFWSTQAYKKTNGTDHVCMNR